MIEALLALGTATVRVEEVIAAGRARAAKEASMFIQLQAGRTTLELLDLEAPS